MDPTPKERIEEKKKRDEIERRKTKRAYQETFATKSGQKVLANLQKHFNTGRPRFGPDTGFNVTVAARIDGECAVLNYIQIQLETEDKNHGNEESGQEAASTQDSENQS